MVGNDGLWHAPEGLDILVEVKTTDAFRVPLNTIADYRDRLRTDGAIGQLSSMLLVVGREDTGELEAQVRGSRHAWDMRLISVDSLVRLVKLKESTEELATGSKIRSVLAPIEYTRLDSLIDVMFAAAQDVESAVEIETQPTEPDDSASAGWDFTDSALLQKKKDQILTALGKRYGAKLIRKSRALYWNAEHTFRSVCTVSKRYSGRGTIPYWYAYHPQWDDFLGEAKDGFFVLGCMDLSIAFAIPVQVIREHLEELSTTPPNTTPKQGERSYWHVKILEQQSKIFFLQMPRSAKHVPLSDYSFDI